MSKGFSMTLAEGEYFLKDIDQAVAEAPNFPPVRKIHGYRGGPRKIKAKSRKNKAEMLAFSRVTLEGDYEFAAFYWLEANPLVQWYKPQPFKVRFHDGLTTTTYVGDFLARMVDGSYTIYEVKKSTNLDDPDVVKRLESLQKAFLKTNVKFEVLLSNELTAQPRLQTWMYLYGKTRSALTKKAVLQTAKQEFLRSLTHLGGSAKLIELKKTSPLVNETGLALAIFDGVVTSKYRLPICDGFDAFYTAQGENQWVD
jgi:hypothetical protein